MLTFNPSKPAQYPNGRVFTDDVINDRLAFLTKGECPPTGLTPHTDTLREFPYLGTRTDLPPTVATPGIRQLSPPGNSNRAPVVRSRRDLT